MVNSLSIAAVERDTGLSRDTLHVWERRYGFPKVARDQLGERSYPLEQMEKLRLVKSLLDAGHRPGHVIPLPMPALLQLARTVPRPAEAFDNGALQAHLGLVQNHDMAGLRRQLARLLSTLGVSGFVGAVAAPLVTAVGEAWLRGRLQVFEEHLFTEVMQGVLRQALADIPEALPASRPHVLLCTLPGEPHGLGLLMAEAMLALEGCACTSMGTQVPLWDVHLAAGAINADIVALSFTGCIGPNQIVDALTDLRGKLAPDVALWAGGSAPVLQRRRVPEVQPLQSLADVATEVRRWRVQNSALACG